MIMITVATMGTRHLARKTKLESYFLIFSKSLKIQTETKRRVLGFTKTT